jgi:uncharacterized membrane protein
MEFNRLNNTDNLPIISDPSGRDTLIEKLGEKEYQETLARYKRNYADEVANLIKSNTYKKMSDENKKEAINEIREEEVLDKTSTKKKDTGIPLY